VDVKNTAPQDIANTALPHTAYILLRERPKDRVGDLQRRVKAGLRVRVREVRRKVSAMKSARD
jgi:hypothetical protein